MKFIAPYCRKDDVRGNFTGLINEITFEEINVIESVAGAVRGGHYHTRTREFIYILEGELELTVRKRDGSAIFNGTISAGATFVIEPFEVHSMTALSHVRWINALTERMDPEAPDFQVD